MLKVCAERNAVLNNMTIDSKDLMLQSYNGNSLENTCHLLRLHNAVELQYACS